MEVSEEREIMENVLETSIVSLKDNETIIDIGFIYHKMAAMLYAGLTKCHIEHMSDKKYVQNCSKEFENFEKQYQQILCYDLTVENDSGSNSDTISEI